MPAPAVIPAPKAYINAVAVKGFVVELWVVQRIAPSILSEGGPQRLRLVNIRNKYHGNAFSPIHARHVRRGASVFITVTKKM